MFGLSMSLNVFLSDDLPGAPYPVFEFSKLKSILLLTN